MKQHEFIITIREEVGGAANESTISADNIEEALRRAVSEIYGERAHAEIDYAFVDEDETLLPSIRIVHHAVRNLPNQIIFASIEVRRHAET